MIYCVEDERNIRELLIYTLETTGFKARGFGNGNELMTALKEEIPELILLDIMLPGDDGYTILEQLKSMPSVKDVPVIMVTAKEAEFDKVKGLEGGADDYITKPFGMMEFVARVKAVLRRSARQNEDKELHYDELYLIPGYPNNTSFIVSDEGYGKNDYIETTRPLVVITAPGPGSGKMATCLSQLYHEYKRGVKAGYAKFETFPIWNIPLKHPVNLAYEAATADLNDVNMIDPFHLEAYGETTINYNRDVEVFPVLQAMFEKIMGECPYKSPTDMGVNMAGNCIVDDEVCKEAARQEIIRRYYKSMEALVRGTGREKEVYKIELLLKQAHVTIEERKVVPAALKREEETGAPAAALELPDGRIVTGKTSELLGASSALLLNALKELAGIDHDKHVISPEALRPIQALKTEYLGSKNPRLHSDETLIALSISAADNEDAKLALQQIPKLKGCQVHTSVLLSQVDILEFRKLGVELTCEPKSEHAKKLQK